MDEVFSEVTAVLSPKVISAIHKVNGDTTQMIVAQIQNTYPAVVLHREHERYLLSGSFLDIVGVKGEIQKILKSIETLNIQPTVQTDHTTQDLDSSGPHLQDATGEHINFTSSTVKPCRKKRCHFYKLRSSKSSSHSIFKKRCHNSLRSDLSALNENLEKMRLSSQESRSDAENKLSDDSSSSPPSIVHKNKLHSRGNYKFFCKICSFKSTRRCHLEKHMRMHKRVRNLIQCNYCDFTTVRLSYLRRHEMIHSSVLHNCKQCSYKTVNKRLLSRHCRLKHGSGSQDSNDVVFNCPNCNYVTDQTHYFDRHQIACNKKQNQAVYECTKCQYKTERKEHLYRHMYTVHASERNYLCHSCGKTFKRKDVFMQHYRTVHEESDSSSNYKCDTCEKTFKSHSSLIEHRAVHSESRLFLCEVCGASFKTRSVQRKHVSSIHGNPRSHSCLSCEKRFNTSFAMKRHQKVHACDKDKIIPLLATSSAIIPMPSATTVTTTTAPSDGLCSTMEIAHGTMVNNTSEAPLQNNDFSSPTTVNIQSISTSVVIPS